MKKIVFTSVIFLFIAGIIVLLLRRLPDEVRTPTASSVSPIPQISSLPVKTVSINRISVAYDYFTTRPGNVSLIANFSDQKTSTQIMSEYHCRYGANGGFYGTDNQPLGLFITNYKSLSKQSNSALFNGFLGIGFQDTPFISHELPDTHNRIVLQTGPLLIVNGQILKLTIKNDEPARRMVAARNANDQLIFVALYNESSTFSGPTLNDTPEFLSAINQKELLNIVDAINLDGGSASAFYGPDTTLSELAGVGSFFCVTD